MVVGKEEERKGRRGGRGEEEDRRKRRGGPAEEEERRRGRGEEEEERKERRGGRGEEERRKRTGGGKGKQNLHLGALPLLPNQRVNLWKACVGEKCTNLQLFLLLFWFIMILL